MYLCISLYLYIHIHTYVYVYITTMATRLIINASGCQGSVPDWEVSTARAALKLLIYLCIYIHIYIHIYKCIYISQLR